MAKKITFIIHGQIKQKEKLIKEINKIFASNYAVDIKETTQTISGKQLAAEATKVGTDYLIAAAGDGTFNEVVNGFLSADSDKETVLGIIPYGSGNDFARNIGYTKNIQQLYDAVENGETLLSDVGRISFTGFDSTTETRFFINITDVGIGGFVSKYANESSKIFGSDITYFLSIVKSFLKFKHQNIKIEADNLNWEGKTLSMCLANSRFFGSGLCIAPDADIADGKADIVILGNVSLFDYIKNLGKVKKCEKIIHPELIYDKTTRCKITSDQACPIDMDGEFIGYAPLELEMLPGKVKLIKPVGIDL